MSIQASKALTIISTKQDISPWTTTEMVVLHSHKLPFTNKTTLAKYCTRSLCNRAVNKEEWRIEEWKHVKCWSHVSWAEIKDPRNVPNTHKTLFLLNVVHKFVYIPVSEDFSIAKIIHPPDSCGISRSWLNSKIITQVHLVLGTIKGHSKNVQLSSHIIMPQMSQVLREHAIVMLTAKMSRVVAR